jgi:hypothetical protein
MSPWLSVLLFGVAVFGFAWLMPQRASGKEGSGAVDEAAYDRLLEDLEMENRELVDAVEKFKEEQDQTVHLLGNRIIELERQMKVWTEQATAAAVPLSLPVDPAADAVAFAESGATQNPAAEAPVQPDVQQEAESQESVLPPTSVRVRYAQLISMHNKGRSVDQIAKTAGMNKGEVQLILQLASREEEQLA